jgi:hypothetical protein
MCSSNKKINYLATRFVPYQLSIVNKINMIWLARVWPDFPASDFKFILAFRNPPTADKIGFVLGLFF